MFFLFNILRSFVKNQLIHILTYIIVRKQLYCNAITIKPITVSMSVIINIVMRIRLDPNNFSKSGSNFSCLYRKLLQQISINTSVLEMDL